MRKKSEIHSGNESLNRHSAEQSLAIINSQVISKNTTVDKSMYNSIYQSIAFTDFYATM